MTKFEEIFGKKSSEPDNLFYTEIEGTFACMTCNVYVETGKWYQMDRVLVWECPQGHKSMIENFG